jgi:hypothetical protein
MRLRPRTILVVTFVAALVVFAAVQDRVTAAGAREYVAQQRLALAGRSTPVTTEEVMAPAIRRSVRDGLIWSGLVMAGGLAIASLSWFRVPGSGGVRRE